MSSETVPSLFTISDVTYMFFVSIFDISVNHDDFKDTM